MLNHCFQREDYINNLRTWFSIKETQKALVPVFVIILISALFGWFAGISKNSCNPYFESTIINKK